MLSFNFFDSNEWEVVSNEAMKDTIKKMREALEKSNDFIDTMRNKIATLEADNDTLRNLNENNTTKIDNQSKEITHLLKAQKKLKAEIIDKEQIISSLDANNSMLLKKVRELNEGIRNSEDLTWKQKYDALQKKCQEYKNSESDATENTIAALVKENKELKEEVNLYIGVCNTKHEEVKALVKAVNIKRIEEKEKQISKDLNVIINSKNKLLDEYMTKCDNLERKYAVLRGKLVSIGELANKIDDVILSEE